MTNIYNKNILVKNGTLIGNWYEEEVLREKTGVGRTIPGKHIPKISGNLDQATETAFNDTYQKDKTFPRIMGETLKTEFSTRNEAYGNFSQSENKYKRTGVKEKIFEDFFKAYVDKEKEEKAKLDRSVQNLRLFDTTKGNLHVTQGCDFGNLGRRHMMTQDGFPVENVDKDFMASHGMSKFSNVLSSAQVGGYVDQFLPYYKDKEITYWSMNLHKGNMYHSHLMGNNPFSKSSGFTQTIHNSKAVNSFNGNVQNSSNSRDIIMNTHDNEYSEKYRSSLENISGNFSNADFTQGISDKIISCCVSKGWLGLRKLKLFLRNLCKRSISNVINKNDFKYFFINFGIVFTEKEVHYIYEVFDKKRNNYINYNEFLDSFVYFPEERKKSIYKFCNQIKNKDNSFLSLKTLEKAVKFDLHPEAVYSNRTSAEIKNEYFTVWDNLKEDDIITQENFSKFFADVSTCVQSNEVFEAILISCGMK